MTNRQIPAMRAPEVSLRLHPHAAQAPPPLSRTQKAYIVSGIESRPYPQRKVCPACAAALGDQQRQQVFGVAGAAECLLCAVDRDDPKAFTQAFCDFLTENPTVFHAVEYSKEKLGQAGFTEVCACPQLFRKAWRRGFKCADCTAGSSSPRGIIGPTRSSPAASTTSLATAPPSSPSRSAGRTSPAPAWP